MVRVSQAARITTSAPRGASELEQSAYAVWATARTGAGLGETMFSPVSDRRGNVYRGSLSGVMCRVWPHLDPKSSEFSSLRSSIYQLLRNSDNARCIQSSSVTKTATWWLAETWKRPTGVVVQVYTGATHAERKLTPAEAGEDREAAPVTVTKLHSDDRAETPAPRNPADALRETHERRRRERAEIKELVYTSVATASQPLVADEVWFDVGRDNDIGRTRKLLRELVIEGRLFARVETPDERTMRCGGVRRATRSQLFSAANPVPARTEQQGVPGFTVPPSPSTSPIRSAAQQRQMTARALRYFIRRAPFTVPEFAEMSGLNDTTLRQRIIPELLDADLITLAQGHRPQRYRIRGSQEEAVRAYIAEHDPTGGRLRVVPRPPTPTPPPLDETTLNTRPAAPVTDADAALAEIARIIESRRDNPEAAARIAELEQENASLRARLGEVTDELEALKRRITGLLG